MTDACPYHATVKVTTETFENPKGVKHKLITCPICGLIDVEDVE